MTSTLPKIKETDLYPPIAALLTAQGFTVRGEVAHCDLTAVRGDELVIVELKCSANLEVLIQATARQAATRGVYVALPRPADLRAARWRGVRRLLRRLELGLILVSFTGDAPSVQIAFHPLPYERKTLAKARRGILREIAARSGDFNTGGSTRTKLMTAYREQALQVACLLAAGGPQSPKALRARGAAKNTLGILARNVYGWFTRLDRALYDITPAGHAALEEFAEVAERYREGTVVE